MAQDQYDDQVRIQTSLIGKLSPGAGYQAATNNVKERQEFLRTHLKEVKNHRIALEEAQIELQSLQSESTDLENHKKVSVMILEALQTVINNLTALMTGVFRMDLFMELLEDRKEELRDMESKALTISAARTFAENSALMGESALAIGHLVLLGGLKSITVNNTGSRNNSHGSTDLVLLQKQQQQFIEYSNATTRTILSSIDTSNLEKRKRILSRRDSTLAAIRSTEDRKEAEEEAKTQEAEKARQRLAIIQAEAVRKIENAAKRKEKVRSFFGRK